MGGHELGHAILDAYGINPGTRWLNELVASYVLYAYLASEHPEQLWLIDVLEVGGRPGQPQRYVSLDDLEPNFLQIAVNDPRNYLWYQAQFFEQIKKIYVRHGVEFLAALRQVFPDGTYKFATLGTVVPCGVSIRSTPDLAHGPRICSRCHEPPALRDHSP